MGVSGAESEQIRNPSITGDRNQGEKAARIFFQPLPLGAQLAREFENSSRRAVLGMTW